MLNNIKTKLTREVILKAIFAFLFSLCNVSIYMMQKNIIQSPTDYHIWIINIVICTLIVYKIISIILNKFILMPIFEKQEVESITKSSQYYWKVFFIHLVCWLPILLAYYPGLFTHDSNWQIIQYSKGYNTHHPLIHSLYLQFFYFKIGDLLQNTNFAIGLSNLVQMIIFASSISFMHLFLKRMNMQKKLRVVGIGFTSIIPIFSVMSFYMVKDVLFTSFVIYFVTILGYFCCKKQYLLSKSYKIILFISVLGVILFRNNGIYPIAFVFLYLIYDSIRNRKVFVIHYVWLAIVCGIGINQLLAYNLHASKGSINEVLSVPYQQLSATYKDNYKELKQDTIKNIEFFIPQVNKYNPYLSDRVKGKGQAKKDISLFFKTYFNLLIQYPFSYLKGFLLLNSGNLCIADKTYASIYGVGETRGMLINISEIKYEKIVTREQSFFPKIRYAYKKLLSYGKIMNIFILNKILTPAVYLWGVCFCFLICLIFKIKTNNSLIVFVGFMILSIICGPCVQIRYAMPFIATFPVIFICTMNSYYLYKNKIINQ